MLYDDLLKGPHHQQPVERSKASPSDIVPGVSSKVVLHSTFILHRVAADVGVNEEPPQLIVRQRFRNLLSSHKEERSKKGRHGHRSSSHLGSGNGHPSQSRVIQEKSVEEEQSVIMSETGEITGQVLRTADAGVHHRQHIVVFEQDEQLVLLQYLIAGKGRLVEVIVRMKVNRSTFKV